MFLRQIIHHDLGCASYFIASEGEAAVVDPKWEIDGYLRLATQQRSTIRHVLETHFHADHVSGRRRLTSATGASAHLPADPQQPPQGGLRDGDQVSIGAVTLTAIAAPGHRPEHLAYLVSEPDRSPSPLALLSGDSLLVRELARPDLAVEAEEGAQALWATLRRLTALGDSVEVWPGHVGGSLCGGGTLCERTSSTIGEERRLNPLLSLGDEDTVVRELTRGVPARPPRVARAVALNLRGPNDPLPDEPIASCAEPWRSDEVSSASLRRRGGQRRRCVGRRRGWLGG